MRPNTTSNFQQWLLPEGGGGGGMGETRYIKKVEMLLENFEIDP